MIERKKREPSKTGGTDNAASLQSVVVSQDILSDMLRNYWLTWNKAGDGTVIDVTRTVNKDGKIVSFTIYYKEEE